jgi:hypothetical protein
MFRWLYALPHLLAEAGAAAVSRAQRPPGGERKKRFRSCTVL